MKANATAIGLALGILAGCGSAHGQPSQEFYKSKQIRMIIGHPVGNDYDLAGRFLARYLSKHIPGEPTIIVQNMPAAGSMAATNYMFSTCLLYTSPSPRDRQKSRMPSSA